MTPDELRVGFRALTTQLYSASAMERRRERFFDGLRRRRHAAPTPSFAASMGS